ncbi:MAG TPA: transcription antitermination factor NusB [Thermoanaerobaculia bacterium]
MTDARRRSGASPAREGAVEILREIRERGGRASALVAARGANLSDPDRGLQRELVLGVLRHRTALDAELAAASRLPLGKLSPGVREVLEVALYQLRHLDRVPDFAAVDEAVTQARRRGGAGGARLVNAVLRRLGREVAPTIGGASSDDADAAWALFFSHPEFLIRRWRERFGDAAARGVLAADNAASPLDLLANPRRTSREELRRALAAEGIATEESLLSPLALSIRSGNPVRSPRLASGEFAIQDIGSQILPLLLPPGELLVDLAAAPGGKSFSALAHGTARRTVALDRSARRLRVLRENARRLGMPEAAPTVADFAATPLPDGRFDRVLLDAPCSGTGTLRKNPEIRWRLSPEAIARIAEGQVAALGAASRLLALDGMLLYSTCSLEREENEGVVERVLSQEPGLRLEEPAPPAPLQGFVSGATFRMLPGETHDGFTAHLLRRIAT